MFQVEMKEMAKSIFKWLQKDEFKRFILFLIEEYVASTETPVDDEILKVIKDWAGTK